MISLLVFHFVHLYLSDVPPHPWHTLGTDLFYYDKMDFLLLVDYFSKFLIVRRILNSTTGAVKKELQDIFTEFENPFMLRSDNGPCYASEEFKFYLQALQIDHVTSSPHYPQSNGLAKAMAAFLTYSHRLLQQINPFIMILL